VYLERFRLERKLEEETDDPVSHGKGRETELVVVLLFTETAAEYLNNQINLMTAADCVVTCKQ